MSSLLHPKLRIDKLQFQKLYVKTSFKGALAGLSQFLVNESPLKMMKNDFYFT